MRLRAPHRKGLSLLEVIVAMAVFLFSLVSLGFLLSVAGGLALDGHHKSEAASLARSKLAEVIVGAVPLESQQNVPFDEDPDYTWSLDADVASVEGLYNVTVTVSRTRPNGSVISSSLSQMVLDPAIVGSVFDMNTSVTDSVDTTATSGSSSSSGSSGTSGTSGSNTTGTKSGGTSAPATKSSPTTTPRTTPTTTPRTTPTTPTSTPKTTPTTTPKTKG